MRVLRFALVAAALVGVSLPTLQSTTAFARGTGSTGGAAGGGSAGGGSSGGAGAGSTLSIAAELNPIDRKPPRDRIGFHRHHGSSCYKQGEMYDRYGYAVLNTHDDECFY